LNKLLLLIERQYLAKLQMVLPKQATKRKQQAQQKKSQ
jgi:hypothetical protein